MKLLTIPVLILLSINSVFAQTFQISGNTGTGEVTLSGAPTSVISDVDGNYSFTVASGWSGTITPSKTGYTFDPVDRTYSNVTSNQLNQDYSAALNTYTISGNTGTGNVTLSGAPTSTTSDGSGDYSFSVDHGWSGTITPSKTGYTFDPSSRSYSNVTSSQSGEDYSSALNQYTISGNTGTGNVTLSGAPTSVTSDGSGDYSFSVDHGWSGTITPSKTGYTFDPSSRSYSNVTSSQSGEDYSSALNQYTISGNTGTGNVTLSGAPSSVTSDGSGDYSFSVDHGWSGTITPSKTGYTFDPSSRSYSNVTSSQSGEDYSAVVDQYTISGNTGTGNVTLSGAPTSVTSDGSGNYSFTIDHGWSGTITPSKSGYTFNPTSRSYSNVTSSQSGEDYSASLNQYTISGNTGTGNVTLSGAPTSVTSDGGGDYSFSVDHGWSGTITPSKTGYSFDPTSRSYSNVTASQSGEDYSAAIDQYTISGNTGTGDVTLSGAPTSVTSNGGGNYSFSVDHGWSGTITPSKTGYTFDPTSRTYSNVTSDQSNQDYTAILNEYTISVSADPAAGGTPSGGGDYSHGSSVTVSANPAEGYTFVNWTENGSSVSNNENYSFTATSDRNLVANYSLNSYTITTSSNPAEGGLTTGGGSYNHGESVTVSATPETGYTFVNWTENGSQVSTNLTYNFTATGNRNLVANFSLNNYSITTSSNPIGGGSTSGGGNYDHGDPVTVTATPASGYSFVNWTENGDQVSTNSSYNFNATGSRDLVANFSLNNYSITTSSNPTEGGSTSGGGNYDHGDPVTVTATPATGYTFVNWTENGSQVSTNPTYDFTATSSRDLVANFSLNNYTVTTSSSPTEGGSTTGGGNYDHGDPVTVTATPATGYTFVEWTENGSQVSTNPTYDFTVVSDRNLVANFSLNTYNISTLSNPISGGTTSGGGQYSHGDEVTLTATPSVGYTFTNWTEEGAVVSTDSVISFTAESDRSLTANFLINTYLIQTNSNPTIGGTTSGGGNYDHGTQVNLTATNSVGYSFENWTEGEVVVFTNPNYSFTATSDRNLTANFSLNNYEIVASPNPAGGGMISGAGNYDHGTEVTLTATPATGYNFINWTEGGTEVSTDSIYTFTAENDRNLVAQFELKKYVLNLSVNPAGSGTTTGQGTYEHGTLVNINTTPAVGWKFDNWKNGETVVSNSPDYSFVILDNTNLIANYSKIIYTITAVSNPSEGGNTTGSGNYEHGSEVTLTANPNTGWRFVNWTDGGNIVSNDSVFTFTAVSAKNYVANYQKRVYRIALEASPEEGGTVYGDSTYTHGDEVVVTAVSNSQSGWDFVNWTENNLEVSTNKEYKFTAQRSRRLKANFKLRSYTVTLNTNPSGSGTASGEGTYTHGDSVTVTATPEMGWLFANWTENSVNVSSDQVYKFEITSNRNLTANFANVLYSIVGVPEPVEAGIITGTGSFYFGQSAVITATPNYGWDFINWEENGTQVSANPIYEFTVSGDRELVANFSLTNFEISCTANPPEAGYTTGCGISFYGQQMTVNAVENNGWKFKNWTESDNIVSNDKDYTFTVERNRQLVANYDLVSDIEKLDKGETIPENYYISNPYPNPFNPETKIEFGLSEPSEVQIQIFNINGQIVQYVLDNISLPAGHYLSRFNGDNISSGIYFFRVFAQALNSKKQMKKVGKLVLVK